MNIPFKLQDLKEAALQKFANKIQHLYKEAKPYQGSKEIINKLFDDIAPRFANRNGGYTRVLKVQRRKGDGALIAVLELTEKKIIEKKPVVKKAAEKAEKKGAENFKKFLVDSIKTIIAITIPVIGAIIATIKFLHGQ